MAKKLHAPELDYCSIACLLLKCVIHITVMHMSYYYLSYSGCKVERSSSVYRVTIAFFALSGLDILNALHTIEADKNAIIDWIYSQQISPSKSGKCSDFM